MLIGAVVGFLITASYLAYADHYKVEIKPDFKSKTIVGKTEIYLADSSAADRPFSFKNKTLKIDEVSSGKIKIKFERSLDKISFTIPKGLQRVSISYHGDGGEGLVFGPDYVYSGYNTCSWMICNIDSLAKLSFEISVRVPDGYTVFASGMNKSVNYPAYLYGFAAGRFNKAQVKLDKMTLQFLGVLDSADSLRRKFKDTERMLKFFQEKSGVALPQTTYTQILVPGAEAQEKSSFSIIGNDMLDPILTDPQEDWVIAHELAHQWWGNHLTCKNWSEFWLNEGITVFMVAAYKEERWGREAYEREMEILKKRYQRAIDEKFDVPLTFAGEYPSLRIKRAIVYSKGALFMNALRKQMGDAAFWKGFRSYTKNYAGQFVESSDLEKEMEKAHGKSLSEIFNLWVYDESR